MRIRRAMLFAAGLGTRMRPLTEHRPKALIEVGGLPLLDHALRRFAEAELERVVVNTHHHAEQVRRHLLRQTLPFEVCVSHEDTLLETGGGIVRALALLGNAPFFSANADAIWLDDGETSALQRLDDAYDTARLDALLLLHPLERAVGYSGPGNFDLAPDGGLLRRTNPPYVFTGLQVLHPRLFAGRTQAPFSLRELYDRATGEAGALARMAGLLHQGEFLHVGSPGELERVNAFFAQRSSAPRRPPG